LPEVETITDAHLQRELSVVHAAAHSVIDTKHAASLSLLRTLQGAAELLLVVVVASSLLALQLQR
jgi:arginine repressor